MRHTRQPNLSLANEEALIDYWRYNIEAALKMDLESLRVIGFRANHDGAFWNTFRDASESMEDRARVISRML